MKAGWQIEVGTECPHHEDIGFGLGEIAGEVDHGDGHGGWLPLAEFVHVPVCRPEGNSLAVAGLGAVGVHGLEHHRLAQPGIGGDDLFDAEDFHHGGVPAIGDDGVIVACLAQQDGLARLREEIDGRGASEAKGALVDAQFQHLLAFGALEA